MTTKYQLMDSCRAGKAAGMDFPTIWHNILKPHPLVMGPPVSTVRDGRIRMEVRLIAGGVIAFDSGSGEILPE